MFDVVRRGIASCRGSYEPTTAAHPGVGDTVCDGVTAAEGVASAPTVPDGAEDALHASTAKAIAAIATINPRAMVVTTFDPADWFPPIGL